MLRQVTKQTKLEVDCDIICKDQTIRLGKTFSAVQVKAYSYFKTILPPHWNMIALDQTDKQFGSVSFYVAKSTANVIYNTKSNPPASIALSLFPRCR